MNFKVLIFICVSAFLMVAFQNCGETKVATGTGETALIVSPLSKSVSQLAIDQVSVREDGNIIDANSGNVIAVDPALNARIRDAFPALRICAYVHIRQPDNVTCLALAIPYAQAVTHGGERINLAPSMCNQDTNDICPEKRDEIKDLVEDVRAAIQAP